MTRQRYVTEFGMGTDVHGSDMTKAACRAVSDAIVIANAGVKVYLADA